MVPRRTKVSRRQHGRQTREQVLAANIDVLFIVTGLDHDYNPRRLERYLLLAHESGASPVIVLNKMDLTDDVYGMISKTRQLAPDVAIVLISALERRV